VRGAKGGIEEVLPVGVSFGPSVSSGEMNSLLAMILKLQTDNAQQAAERDRRFTQQAAERDQQLARQAAEREQQLARQAAEREQRLAEQTLELKRYTLEQETLREQKALEREAFKEQRAQELRRYTLEQETIRENRAAEQALELRKFAMEQEERLAEQRREEKVARDEKNNREREEKETGMARQLDNYTQQSQANQLASERRICEQVTERNNELSDRIKKATDITRSLLIPFPQDPSKIPSYFDSLERIFELYEIRNDIWIALLTPLLCEKARLLLTNLPVEKIATYALLKKALLRKFKLTPAHYLERFNSTEKKADESYVNLATRMRSNFNYYLQSREINGDYNNIVDLIISDKIKSSLRWDTRERVRQKEGVNTWLKPRKLSLLADTHEVDKPNYKGKTSGNNNNDKSKNNNHSNDKAAFATPAVRKSSSYQEGRNRVGNKNEKEERKCFICNETNHVYQFCPLKGKKQPMFPSWSVPPYKAKRANRSDNQSWRNSGEASKSAPTQNKSTYSTPTKVNRVVCESQIDLNDRYDVPDLKPLIDDNDVTTIISKVNVNSSSLIKSQPVNVKVVIGDKKVDFIIDSGTEISVIPSKYVPEHLFNSEYGFTNLQSAFGNSIEAKFIHIPCHLENTVDDMIHQNVLLSCAITDELKPAIGLLSLNDYNTLTINNESYVCSATLSRSSDAILIKKV